MSIDMVSLALLMLGPFTVGVGVGMALGSKRRRDDRSLPPPAAIFGPLGSAEVRLPADLAVRVLRETRGGHAVKAVKLMCDATGLELAAAKAVVDDLRRHDAAAR